MSRRRGLSLQKQEARAGRQVQGVSPAATLPPEQVVIDPVPLQQTRAGGQKGMRGIQLYPRRVVIRLGAALGTLLNRCVYLRQKGIREIAQRNQRIPRGAARGKRREPSKPG
ncbi:hypothetical protein SDC9_212942 [bioreactor metagenome]|uniref:Uncharacterized protein n=1 Tax=bioreactor metagenome TaxID=1076179 RepID=A0A645K288_9ZZZZ